MDKWVNQKNCYCTLHFIRFLISSSPSGSRSERRVQQSRLQQPAEHVSVLRVWTNLFLLRRRSSHFTNLLLLFDSASTLPQTQLSRGHPQTEERHSPLPPDVQAAPASFRPHGARFCKFGWLPFPHARLPFLRDRPHPEPQGQTPGSQKGSDYPESEGDRQAGQGRWCYGLQERAVRTPKHPFTQSHHW